jgi:hypothetical protein
VRAAVAADALSPGRLTQQMLLQTQQQPRPLSPPPPHVPCASQTHCWAPVPSPAAVNIQQIWDLTFKCAVFWRIVQELSCPAPCADDQSSVHVLSFNAQMTAVPLCPSSPAFAPLPCENQAPSCVAGQAGTVNFSGSHRFTTVQREVMCMRN